MASRLCALLLLLPALAWGHGAEFLGAKLQVLPARELLLEITADYGDNPMIADRAEAEAAIMNLLEVRWSGQSKALSALAPLTLEERTRPDPSSPLPTDESGTPHQLLTAVWRWTAPPDATELRFHVPASVSYNTVFWLEEAGVERERKKWSMLFGGDSTPPIQLAPLSSGSSLSPALAFAVILCLSAALVVILRRTRSRTLSS